MALLARKGALADDADGGAAGEASPSATTRERAIEILTERLPADSTIVSTTGKISRELYEHRARQGQDRASDFLTVGCMGHASQIALGIALSDDARPVVCLDGDGAMLMHMGGVATIGARQPSRFLHLVLNNGVHDSVGGQPTVGLHTRLTDVARASGYATVLGPVEQEGDIREAVGAAAEDASPAFVEIRVAPGARPDLGRPKETPQENKALFTSRLRQGAAERR